MADLAFDDSLHGQMLHNVAGSRPLSISTMGESHGEASRLGMAIQWACWEHYPANIRFDLRAYGDGGNIYAVGGTTSGGTNGLLDQIARFQARPTDCVFIAASYNDQPGNLTQLDTLVANNITAAEACFAAGAKFVVIVGATPVSYTGSATFLLGFNLRMRMWAAQRDGAFFLDVSSVLADRQNANANTIGWRHSGAHSNGAYLSMTDDGTHWSGHGSRSIAPLIADILRRIAPRRTVRGAFNSSAYDQVHSPYGNLISPVGGMMGDQGMLNWSTTPGTLAGVDTNSRLYLTTGSIDVTPSLEPGPDGERVQRFTLGGGSADTMIVTFGNPLSSGSDGGVSTRRIDLEVKVRLTGIVGLTNIVLRPAGDAPAYYSARYADDVTAAHRFVDGTDHELFCYGTFPAPLRASGDARFDFGMMFTFASGSTPGGVIDISNASAALVGE